MFNGRSTTPTMPARRRRWMMMITIMMLISINLVSSMSLDRLALERNELPNPPVANEDKGQFEPSILVDDLKLTAAPNGGNTDTYMLVPASVANQLDQSANVILNTIENVPESTDLESDMTNPNSDMLMLESDQDPAIQMVALPNDITVAEAPAPEPAASESMELISEHVVDLHKPTSQEEVQLENVEQAVDTATEEVEKEYTNEEQAQAQDQVQEQAQEQEDQQQQQEQQKAESSVQQHVEESSSTESLAHIMADAVDVMEKEIEEVIEPEEAQQDAIEKVDEAPIPDQSAQKDDDTTEIPLRDSMANGIEEGLPAANDQLNQQEEQPEDSKDEEKQAVNEEVEGVEKEEAKEEEKVDEKLIEETKEEEKVEDKNEEIKQDDENEVVKNNENEEEKKETNDEVKQVANEAVKEEEEEEIAGDKEVENKQETEQLPEVEKEETPQEEKEVIKNDDETETETETEEEKKPELEQETEADKPNVNQEEKEEEEEPLPEKEEEKDAIKENNEIPQESETQNEAELEQEKEAEKDTEKEAEIDTEKEAEKDTEKEAEKEETFQQDDALPISNEIQKPVEENEVEPLTIIDKLEDNQNIETVQMEEEKKEEPKESEIQTEQTESEPSEPSEVIQTEIEPEKIDTTDSETETKPESSIIEETSNLDEKNESNPINNDPTINNDEQVEETEPKPTQDEIIEQQQPIETVQDENKPEEEQQEPESEISSILTTIIPMVAIPQQQEQTEKPIQVTDSVLNYVNASFMQAETDLPKVEPETDTTSSFNAHLRRYDGAQVWRIVVQTDKDKKMADELQTKYDGQLWKEVKQEVDYLLKPQVLAAAERHIRAANLSRIVLIDNLQQVIEVENPSAEKIAELQNRKGHRLSWQAYHRLEDIHGFIDYMAKTYPDICSTEIIGYSVEKRPLKILKISNGNARNPGIWIDGGMHAREWISPATVTFIANQLIEGWEDLPEHMRNINWFIHPVANPDGYEYSHTTDRLWRKNMRAHGRQCPGVDLNRNFGYKWGGKGTSASPCSQTYRGSKAFSEPETFYISKFISGFPRETFQAYLSFHSYGQYILYPWGYDYHLTQDRADLDRVARQAGTSITKSTGVKYTVGSSATTLYPAAGGSDDWAKGIAGIKYAYTIEMGDTGRYGFVLPARFIQYNGKDGYTFADTVARAIAQGRSGGQARRRRH